VKTKHTPGPWAWTKGGDLIAKTMTGGIVPVLSSGYDSEYEPAIFGLDSDATLIEAAPDLLESLKGVMSLATLPDWKNGRKREALQTAHDLIASLEKITGVEK
jgi:hypothetical protein